MNWKDYAFDVYYGREDCDDETNYLLEEMDEELEELWESMDRRTKVKCLAWMIFEEE